MTDNDIFRNHPLATKPGLELFVGLLVHTGAMCPKCGFGTRKTTVNRYAHFDVEYLREFAERFDSIVGQHREAAHG